MKNFQVLPQLALDTGQTPGQGLYISELSKFPKMKTELAFSKRSTQISLEEKNNGLLFIKSNFNKLSQRKMAKTLGFGNTTINRWSREIGLVFKKHTVNETFFNEFNEASAYLLGLIYADGNIAWNPKKGYYSLTITASEKDGAHLENIRNLLSSTKPLLYAPKTKSYRLIVSNKNLCRALMGLGVTPKKSLTVKFPEIPGAYLRHFVRGVIDGDGNVRYVSRKRSPYFEITIASGSIEFCKGLVEAIKESLGIDANIREVAKNVYVIQYSCSRGERLAEYTYQDATTFLNRKNLEYEKLLEARKKWLK